MRYLLTIVILASQYFNVLAKVFAPTNDEITGATYVNNTSAYCSSDGQFNNNDATSSNLSAPSIWNGQIGKDVWFKFTATKYDVNISVSGFVNANSSSTLTNPLVALYTFDQTTNAISEQISSLSSSSNVTSLYKGSLIIGEIYYVRVSAQNNATGTFKLCIDNYFPPILPGQDYASSSALCSKESFTQLNVSGAGNDRNEGNGLCIGSESNSAWYKFTAKDAGTLTFTITPTVSSDDIDWALFDLGPAAANNIPSTANLIRCAAGSGVTCSPSYYKTGLSLTETDLNEAAGCPSGANGFLKYVDLVPGNVYAIIINNFSRGNNGFTFEFGGTSEFEGPKAEIDVTEINPCTNNQSFIFESKSQNYSSLEWNFGQGATTQTATTAGPFAISYTTPGEKVIVLKAKSTNICSEVITTQKVYVGPKPDKPIITANRIELCEDDVLILNTPYVEGAQYFWSGPNSFISEEQNPQIGIVGDGDTGDYELYIKVGNCISDTEKIAIIAHTRPQALFALTGSNLCKSDQYFTVTNTSINYNKVTWDFGPGVKSATDIDAVNKKLIYASSGQKTITLIVENEFGCTATRTIDLYVEIAPEKPIININKNTFCLGDVIELSTDPVENLTYTWKGPNNFTANTSNISIPVDHLNKAGRYELVALSGSCISDIAYIDIPKIDRTPVANFNTNPNFDSKFSIPLTIQFSNASQFASQYEWDFGDGSTSAELNPIHTYTTDGTYKITLNALSENGCFNAIVKGNLIIFKNANTFTPNAFTPNGDGVNDEFIINVTNLTKYRIQIVNRLGNLVFQTDNIFTNWNGKFKNEDMPSGVYYYIINAINTDNQAVKFSGSITLIR